MENQRSWSAYDICETRIIDFYFIEGTVTDKIYPIFRQ